MLVLYRDEAVEDSASKGLLWGIAGPQQGLPIPLETLKDNIQITDANFPVINFINPTSPNYPLADIQQLPIHPDLTAVGQCPTCEGTRYWYTITTNEVVTIHRKPTP